MSSSMNGDISVMNFCSMLPWRRIFTLMRPDH